MKRLTDEERLTSILRWDVKRWGNSKSDHNNSCYCIKCSHFVGDWKNHHDKRKLCSGKKSWGRIELCPHDISHFHHNCGNCGGTWIEAAKDEGPTQHDEAVAWVKKAYESLMNNSNGEITEEDLIRIWRETVSKDLLEK